MAKKTSADDYYTPEKLAEIAHKYRHWSNTELSNSIEEDAMMAYTLRVEEEIKRFDENPAREISRAFLWG